MDRHDNERSEVITWKYFDDPGISDVIVMINNDNYLFDAPMDWDSLRKVIEQRMNYVKKQYKTPMTPEEEEYWIEKITKQVIASRDQQSTVVLPKMPDLQSVIRKMKKYLSQREVK
jgi:hypothetical protein